MKTKNVILSVTLCGCLLLVGCGKNEDTSKITRDYMEYNNSVLAKNVDDFKDKMETDERIPNTDSENSTAIIKSKPNSIK